MMTITVARAANEAEITKTCVVSVRGKIKLQLMFPKRTPRKIIASTIVNRDARFDSSFVSVT